MERSATTRLRIGAWLVNPMSGQISRGGEIARLEERTMRLLLCLAEHAGEASCFEIVTPKGKRHECSDRAAGDSH
jgi:DNA-binding response OmpR family regulator